MAGEVKTQGAGGTCTCMRYTLFAHRAVPLAVFGAELSVARSASVNATVAGLVL